MTKNMKKAISVLSLAGFLFAGAALATSSYAEMTDYGFLGAVTDEQRAEQYAEGRSVGEYVEPDYWGTEFGKVDMDQNYKNGIPIKPCLEFGVMGPYTDEDWNKLRQQ